MSLLRSTLRVTLQGKISKRRLATEASSPFAPPPPPPPDKFRSRLRVGILGSFSIVIGYILVQSWVDYFDMKNRPRELEVPLSELKAVPGMPEGLKPPQAVNSAEGQRS
jgi:hypothetical protein